MTAAEEFLRGLWSVGGWIDGYPKQPEPAETDEPASTHTTCTPEEGS